MREDRELDGLYRAGAPAPPPEKVLARVAARVAGRLESRRRRLRAGRVLAGGAAAAAAVLLGAFLAIVSAPRDRTPSPGTTARVETMAPEAPTPPPEARVKPGPAKPRPKALRRPDAARREPPSLEARLRELRLAAGRSPAAAARLFWRECGRPEEDSPGGLKKFLAAALPDLPPAVVLVLARELPGRPECRGGSRPPDSRFLRALGASGAAQAWPLLRAVLEARGADIEAIRAAGDLGDPRALPWLERWLPLADGRGSEAVEALARIPGAGSTRLLLSAHAALGSGMEEFFPGRAERLRDVLAARKEEALACLRAACASDPGRREALRLLVDLFPGEAGVELRGLLAAAPRPVQPLVFQALARLGSDEAAALLRGALHDPSLRRLAQQSLNCIEREKLSDMVSQTP